MAQWVKDFPGKPDSLDVMLQIHIKMQNTVVHVGHPGTPGLLLRKLADQLDRIYLKTRWKEGTNLGR